MHSSNTDESGTTIETAVNLQLAELLRRFGLDAEAEQRNVIDTNNRQHQVDVLVELEDECIAIEAEFSPARSVKTDALSRLPANYPLLWRGQPITRALTLAYPNSWKYQPTSITLPMLETCTTLELQQVMLENGGAVWANTQTVSVRNLADLLLNYWTQSRKIAVDDIVEQANKAISAAATILANEPYIIQLSQADENSDPAATCALVWLNALLFQALLAANLAPDKMPPQHRQKAIPALQSSATKNSVLLDWEFILEINWVPIFELAHESLERVSPQKARLALEVLRTCANYMSEHKAIKRHDIAGRIFHRLLNNRKFLATNYTTIPAAVILAGLAFGSTNSPLANKPTHDCEALAKQLRIVDPSCGSGTLLMAALQEVLKACRANSKLGRPDPKPILEQSIFGYDVVPGAQHLTNTTLSMAETSQTLSGIHIYAMPHDVESDSSIPRLGSLDFLQQAPNHLSTKAMELFPPVVTATRKRMSGEEEPGVHLPQKVDLFISNPPYTRAGGPGSSTNTEWNPLFGSVLSQNHVKIMQSAITKSLQGTFASMYAGLGSAFMALIDQELREGGMLAVVLPITALTGSRWRAFRRALLDRYTIEWVVTSHDPRHRSKRTGLPGRRWCSFSESTRIAEILLIATRTEHKTRIDNNRVKFVNLRHNPDEPSDAIALTRALLNHKSGLPITAETDLWCADIDFQHHSGDKWGEIVSIPQSQLTSAPWQHVAFTDCTLTEAATVLASRPANGEPPITLLGDIADLGPYHMQIKGKHGLFDCSEAVPKPLQIAGLWHHNHKAIVSLATHANAVLRRRPNLKPEQDKMMTRMSRLHIAGVLGHAPQRLAAVITEQHALGISSWITIKLNVAKVGAEEALCLWLNSTLGMLLRLSHANRPYLGRSGLPHELARTLPVLDVTSLSNAQLGAALEIYQDIKSQRLLGFAHLADDPTRQALNHRLAKEVLGYKETQYIDQLTRALASDPLMLARN